MKFTRTWIALVALGCAALPAWSEEAPASAYDAKRATLPWPAAEKAFTFDGEILMNGMPVATFSMKATPRTDVPGWQCHATIGAGGGQSMVATYDANLKPVSGEYTHKSPTGTVTKKWSATAAGVTLAQDDAEAKQLAQSASFLTASMTDMILFCRLSGLANGSYKMPLLILDESKFVDATLSIADGTWKGQPAKMAKGQRSDGRSMELALHATSGDVLGLKLKDAHREFEVRAKDAKDAKDANPKDTALFTREPRDAKEAALQAGLAFSLSDADMLARIVSWPDAHKHALSADPTTNADAAAWKELVLAHIRNSPPYGTRDSLETALRGAQPLLKVTGDDTTSVVEFPPQMQGLKLAVGKRDGKWRLVQMPS